MTRAPEDEIVSLAVSIGSLARAVDRHPNYRVLSRIRRMERREEGFARTGELSVCVLHLEASGDDPDRDRILELSLQTVRIDRHGRIVDSGRNYRWFEDPGFPLAAEVTARTGVTSEDVNGRAIADGEAYGELSTADVVLSHDAGAHRPFVDVRLGLETKPWICSRRDLDWSAHGFEGVGLADLLQRCGLFFEGQGAHRRVNALLHLLDRPLLSGGTVMKELLRSAARPSWTFTLANPSAASQDLIEERGYRRRRRTREWTRHVADDAADAEREWFRRHVQRGARGPRIRRMTWKERHAR